MTTQTIIITIAGITVGITIEAGAAPVIVTPVPAAPTSHRTPIAHSSVIASVGYDAISRTLDIEFRDGDVYQYDNVPSYVYDELIETRSAGQYFTYYIRGQYTTRKITR